jgi:flagellar hook-associated protein 3 FlgL
MIVPNLTLIDSLAFSLDQTTSKLQLTEQQLATGKRVMQPSDDPVAYSEAQLSNQAQSAVSNDLALAQQTQGRLATVDNALASVTSSINSALVSATQGADGSITPAQMQTIGTQVQGILDQVIAAADQQYAGSHVFAGNQILTTPFNPLGAYAGDAGTNSVTFSDGTKLQLSFDGKSIFGDNATGLIGTLTSLVAALNAGNKAAVSATMPRLQAALQTVVQARSLVGISLNAASNLLGSSNNELTILQTASDSLVGVDVAQAAMHEQETLLQQQALVSLGSSFGKLPLVNILA